MRHASRLPGSRLLHGSLLLAALLAGCVRLIAGFDEQTRNEILADARLVDRFYGELLETDEAKRPYVASAPRYVQVETELRALVLRNEARPLNQDSTDIARKILLLWQQTKDLHKRRDGYPGGSARLDRESFGRLFLYALTAEQAKPGEGDRSRAETGLRAP
jgi:hypothetical protein